MKTVSNKQDYIARVQIAVSRLHDCVAIWSETLSAREVFRSKTVWQGDVEVFDLTGHPKAKRAFAWGYLDGAKDERERIVAVLEIPPVEHLTLFRIILILLGFALLVPALLFVLIGVFVMSDIKGIGHTGYDIFLPIFFALLLGVISIYLLGGAPHLTKWADSIWRRLKGS